MASGLPFLDKFLHALKPSLYDDFVDRLHYYITTLLLLFFAILVSAKQYVGAPIQCWVPAQFRGGWEQYTEDYCFVQNTYFLPIEEFIPRAVPQREAKMIGYYQWVPIVLAMEALLFYIPHFIWKTLNWQSGLHMKSVLKSATSSATLDPEKRSKELEALANYIEDSLGMQNRLMYTPAKIVGSIFVCASGGGARRVGSFVSAVYLFMKVLYLVNVVGQFFLLNAILGTHYQFWGWQILQDLIRGREWHESGHFPRVTMCDFEVRELGNVHRHTVQCVLMINMFNEKIFLFLWFWFLFISVLTAVNILYWSVELLPISRRENLIHRYLRVAQDLTDSPADKRAVSRFTSNALRPDGVLLLHFVASHAGELCACELTSHLWRDYGRRQREQIATMPRLDHSQKSIAQNENGLIEAFYPAEKQSPTRSAADDVDHGSASSPLLPSAPGERRNGYPGPPLLPPKTS